MSSKSRLQSWRSFFRNEIWSLEEERYNKGQLRLLRLARILLLAFRGFTENSVQLRASALTFYSLMSLVPVLALGFGIARGFGLDPVLAQFIQSRLKHFPELSAYLIQFSSTMLSRTGAGLVAGGGTVLLFWAVIKVFSNIERSFNAIWQIDTQRSWTRKFSDYLSMVVVAPLLIFMASSVNVYLRSILRHAVADTDILSSIKPMLRFLLGFSPYVFVSLVLVILYIIMPNTQVKFKSGLVSGVLAGVFFTLLQWGYFHFQVGLVRYSAIYGSFAAVPLFIVWMQISWMIILLGAEISYAVQNVHLYQYEQETNYLSPRRTKELSLLLLMSILKNFREGKDMMTSTDLATRHDLPLRLTRRLLHWMVEAKILALVQGYRDKTQAYALHVHPDVLTVDYVLKKYDEYGTTVQSSTPEIEKVELVYDIYMKHRPLSDLHVEELSHVNPEKVKKEA